MKTYLDCYPCLVNMALTTARLVGLDDKASKMLVDKTMRVLIDSGQALSPPQVNAGVYKMLTAHFALGDKTIDPYHQLKRKSNQLAMKYIPFLEKIIDTSKSRLETGIKVAAAGNIIDFSARDHAALDIEKEIKNIASLSFGTYDFQPLVTALARSRKLLFIGDNAGEIVFDKILIREIRRAYPRLKVTYAVRGKPIINDATLEDAVMVGMDKVAEVVSSGSIYPGTILDETTEQFKKLFKKTKVVIAKGQGNFETLADVKKSNLFFILRVKCDLIAKHIGSKVGSLVLYTKG